jgi:hypothetical protein
MQERVKDKRDLLIAFPARCKCEDQEEAAYLAGSR